MSNTKQRRRLARMVRPHIAEMCCVIESIAKEIEAGRLDASELRQLAEDLRLLTGPEKVLNPQPKGDPSP